MARINTYALDSDITKSDIVLGSDGGQTTKNFQIMNNGTGAISVDIIAVGVTGI